MSAHIRLYHNPRCGTSRTVLSQLEEQGIDVEIILYLEQALSAAKLQELVAKSGKSADYLLRSKEAAAAPLAQADEAEIIAAIAAEPILLNRPVLETAKQVFVCRPAAALADILAEIEEA